MFIFVFLIELAAAVKSGYEGHHLRLFFMISSLRKLKILLTSFFHVNLP